MKGRLSKISLLLGALLLVADGRGYCQQQQAEDRLTEIYNSTTTSPVKKMFVEKVLQTLDPQTYVLQQSSAAASTQSVNTSSKTASTTQSPAVDSSFALRAVYVFPNPAVGGAQPTIHVAVGVADQVTITIFDMAGHEATRVTLNAPPVVITDTSGSNYAYEWTWTGRIPSGTYLYVVEAKKSGLPTIHKSGTFSVVR